MVESSLVQRKLDPKEELAGREVAGVLAHQSASLLAGSILGTGDGPSKD